MSNKQYTFSLQNILFPLIASQFSNKEQEDKKKPLRIAYKIAYKIKAEVISSKEVDILFGIQVAPENPEDKDNLTVVEVLGTFVFSDDVFKNKVKSIGSIESLPNMLAILLPFIREKIHACFYNNKINFYLPAINAFKLTEDLKSSIKIIDKRS